MIFTYKELVDKLDENAQLNSNRISCHECYCICANKPKLKLLLKDENQVIMGRRGTGKTTLFKAFAYYVNKIESDMKKRAWYISLDECVPNAIELESNSADDVSVYILKCFLLKLLDFLYYNLAKYEKNRTFVLQNTKLAVTDYQKKIDKIENLILELEELIEGSPKENSNVMKVDEQKEAGTSVGVAFSKERRAKLKGKVSTKWTNTHKIIVQNSKEYLYKIDLRAIRDTIIQIFQEFGYQKVYICLDEFNLIDRRTTVSLQSRLAQLMKELFFANSLFVVKIANVWNESRMQKRDGEREGLELGHDIFWNRDLDLDTMFEHDNQKAQSFFVDYIVNNSLLNEEFKDESMKEYVKSEEFKTQLMEQLFAKDALKCLVCGSQGVPRIFGEILGECLKKVKSANYVKKITVEMVSAGIMANYNTNIRKSIPYDSILYMAIDDHINEHLCRFFLVRMVDYNQGKRYFDALVATNALHQCPAEQLPRKMKNRYKMFYVHYGNYLDAMGDQLKIVSADAKADTFLLYPDFPENFEENVNQYLLDIPADAFKYLYCDDCHEYFERSSVMKGVYIKCPQCEKLITHWQ